MQRTSKISSLTTEMADQSLRSIMQGRKRGGPGRETTTKGCLLQPRSENTYLLEPARKRVKFKVADILSSDKVKTYTRYLEILRSDLDKPSMWWSRSEREEISETCRDEILDFRRHHTGAVEHFSSVFVHCQKSPSLESSEYLESATIDLPLTIRGLEWGFAPNTISLRRSHVRQLLSIQDKVHALSPEMRDRVLSSRSLRSSRPCRVLARILGEGDARDCDPLSSERPKIDQRKCRKKGD